MSSPLSFLQEQALISLHRGWHFGIEGRTLRGLLTRGLVELRYYNELVGDMPFLTEAGKPVAADLDAADRRRHFERRTRGSRFGVIDGGLA